ncbi:P-selectin [Drosophila biarmipes]|uniref:P-selectin n=1 Tax=Drosophila biarmipes TaxID=125945 RepID=UPI0007E85779|nr:P-selectin [Drosophila biarmipes]
MSLASRILYCLPILLIPLHIEEANAKGICLYFSDQLATWFDALITCQKHYMCLADLDTEVTLIQMESKLPRDDHSYWFGLNAHEKNSYRYVSSNKSADYSPVSSNLVNDGGCAFVKHDDGFYKFLSADCHTRKRFICSRAEECDGVSISPRKSQCVISPEDKEIVAY